MSIRKYPLHDLAAGKGGGAVSGRASQKKGRSGELEIVKIFQAHGIDAQPGRAVSYGATPDVLNIPGVHPEVKRVERLNVQEAMNQAIRDSEKFRDGTPVLFHRRNRCEWLCTMRMADWIRYYVNQAQEQNPFYVESKGGTE